MLPGDRVAWWRDATGDERGLLMAMPFAGGEPSPSFPSLPEGWLDGALVRSRDRGDLDGDRRRLPDLPDRAGRHRPGPRTTTRPRPAWGRWSRGSAAGSPPTAPSCASSTPSTATSCMRRSGCSTRARARWSASSRTRAATSTPSRGRRCSGDQRLAFTSELGAFERPAIWDVRSGERRDLDIDLPGGVFPVRWWPDAAALLGRHEHEGRAQLVRIDLATGATATLTGLDGDIDGAGIRPDGSVWFRVSDAVRPPRIMQAGGGEVVTSPDAPPPAGRPYASRFATNAHGDRIQMFVVTPDGPGPFPTVCNIHGGPEWHERDRFDAETQAFVDRGYAVAVVNYRGSTGYGIAFREALRAQRVLHRDRGHPRVRRRAGRRRHHRPRPRLLERLVVGRLPRVLQRGHAPRPLARDLRRDPGRRLRGGTPRLGAGAPGLGRSRLRRHARAGARPVRAERPDDLRRRACARPCW